MVLHLGSNLGDRQAFINKALEYIDLHIGQIIKKSALYQTKAWGNEDQPDFINQALLINSSLSPFGILNEIEQLYSYFPRKPIVKWGPRSIDVDIIYYGDKIIETRELKIPHPHMHIRNFVLSPLIEIIPDWIHPILKWNTLELNSDCQDEGLVIKLA